MRSFDSDSTIWEWVAVGVFFVSMAATIASIFYIIGGY